MPSSSKATQYPWGTTTPRERLRTLCEKVRSAMQAATEPGYTDIPDRVKSVVQASHPLVETMAHLGHAGLRPSTRTAGGSELPLTSDAVLSSVDSVNASLASFVHSTIHDVSDQYRGFAEACEALLELAERAIQSGIAGGGSVPSGDPWKVFDF